MISIRYSHTDRLYTVGQEIETDSTVSWMPLKDCNSREEAMAWLSYLNGGVHPNEIEGYWNKTYWQDNAEKAMR
jgi:hypothetical protein